MFRPVISGGRDLVELIISPDEFSIAHGTGVLMTRILEEAGPFVTLRSHNHWGGAQAMSPVDDILIPDVSEMADARGALTEFVARRLERYPVRVIVAVCKFAEDVRAALAAKAATGAPLSVYLTEDRVLYNPVIPHGEMAELLEAADARFAISSEMRTAYQNTFQQSFFVMPPVVAERFIRSTASPPAVAEGARKAVMIGNIWRQEWLDRLCAALEDADVQLTWYAPTESDACNADGHGFEVPRPALLGDRLKVVSNVTTSQMIDAITAAAVAIVPSGASEAAGHERAITRLTLPTSMPFIAATAGTPMLVLGEPDSCAAEFLRRFGVGEQASYDRKAITVGINHLTDTEVQTAIREEAAELGPLFSATGAYQLLTDTAIDRAPPADERFERAFANDCRLLG